MLLLPDCVWGRGFSVAKATPVSAVANADLLIEQFY